MAAHRLAAIVVVAVGCMATYAHAQAPVPSTPNVESIGTVGLEDATVSGDLVVAAGRAMLVGSTTVLAGDHTAQIKLRRGGELRVCATTSLHLSQAAGGGAQPLMIALDRGALELQTGTLPNDVVLTPDLRFAARSAGPLDLHIRVTRNGDTCVENNGSGAPLLGITDQFGESTYELRPNQHVLFEHGSLKEVVDRESSPCGCPAETPASQSIADALLASKGTPAARQAAAANPFPAAVSEGLAPPPAIPQAAPGTPHVQVAATLGYTADASKPDAGGPVPEQAAGRAPVNSGLGHRIGRFFKRLFGG